MKRVAIIGYGVMGSWHVKQIQAGGAVELAGIYDIDPKMIEKAKSRDIHVYDSLEELLADESVEIVTIATPNQLHKPLAIKALNAGKNVISEKPVTLCCKDLQDIIDVANKCGKRFTVHQNRRWDGEFVMMKDLYDNGTLGDVFGLRISLYGSHGIPGDWRATKECGGGMLYDWGVHLIDEMLYLVGDLKIKSVYCQFDNITNAEVDDGFKLDINFENGMMGRIEVGTNNFISLPMFYMTGTNGTALVQTWRSNCKVVACTNWDPGELVPVVTSAGVTRTMAPRNEDTITEYEIPRVKHDVHDFYRNFIKAVDGEEEQLVTHKQMMRVIKVIEAAFKSAEIEAPVKFEN